MDEYSVRLECFHCLQRKVVYGRSIVNMSLTFLNDTITIEMDCRGV